jgi:thiol-disulfide isomerase/thioredoxin
MMNRAWVIIAAFILLSACSLVHAQQRKAPEWVISEWINGPGVTLNKLKGKVIIVEFFQLWCPGCNGFSIPLMKKWNNTFKDEIKQGKLALLSIHTVFEGHDLQTPERLKTYVKEKNIRHPVGIDKHQPGERIPETMKRYRTRGTPEIAVIEKQGMIRFQMFGGFEAEKAEEFIRRIMDSP